MSGPPSGRRQTVVVQALARQQLGGAAAGPEELSQWTVIVTGTGDTW